ncbi:hypothetical protein [Desulfonatronum parangueonense]
MAWLLQEYFAWPTDQVAACRCQVRLALGHFVPDPAQGVVREKFYHIARSEELVANGEFPAVARGRGLGTHFFALFHGVEILIDPADGFILGPELFQFRGVDQAQQIFQGCLTGEQPSLGAEAVEEHGQVQGEFVEQAEQIALVGVPGLAQGCPGQLGIRLETFGLSALGNGFDDQIAGFGHAQGAEAVEYGEGLFTHDPVQNNLHGFGGLRGTGQVMVHGLPQQPGRLPTGVVQMGQPIHPGYTSCVRVKTMRLLQLLGEFRGQQRTRLTDEFGQAVTGRLIESHDDSFYRRL